LYTKRSKTLYIRYYSRAYSLHFKLKLRGETRMNMKSLASVTVAIALLVVLAAAALAVPVTIDRVEINGDQVTTGDTNLLSLERGQDLNVKVRISGTGNTSDVEIRGFVSGFEHNQDQAISDVTPVFRVQSGTTYIKTLDLRLPDIAEEDSYLLRIFVSDRFSPELIQSFKIRVDVARHNIAIRDVVLNPEKVVAGRALLATVRVKNMGSRDEEGIKIKVEIPELDVSATDYMDKLDSDESSTSEELYLRIPACAKPGDYTVRTTVSFNDGFDKLTTTKSVEVTASDSCGENSNDKTVIGVDRQPQVVVVGGAGAVFPITISNQGGSSKVYTLQVQGADDWATVRVSPSNVVVAKAGEVKTVSLYLSPRQDATTGDHSFAVTITDQAGNVVEQLEMRASVKNGNDNSGAGLNLGGARKYLEVGLVVLVVLLIVIALIFVFSKLFSGADDEEEAEPKTYY
jgi:uncharacterized membrane protein